MFLYLHVMYRVAYRSACCRFYEPTLANGAEFAEFSRIVYAQKYCSPENIFPI